MALVNLLCLGSPILVVWFLAWFRPEELQQHVKHLLAGEAHAADEETTVLSPTTLWMLRLVSLALVVWIIASGVKIASSIVYGVV